MTPRAGTRAIVSRRQVHRGGQPRPEVPMHGFHRSAHVIRLLAVTLLLAGVAWAVSSTQVIYSFAGDEDGEYTDTDLVLDSRGNIYGTTVLGGDFGTGSVFELSPSGNTWTHTILY